MSQTGKSEWERSRECWPQFSLSKTDFLAFLKEHGFSTEIDLETSKGVVDFAELYVVCACLRQEPCAGDTFSEQYFARARPSLQRMQLSSAMCKDIEQGVWEKLFTDRTEAGPKILEYVGQGKLAALIKVIVVRAAVSELRKNKREVLCDSDELLALPDELADPALELVRADFKKEFAPAFTESLAALSERDRNFLRLRFVEGLQIDQISRMYQVHRVTASRMLSRIRHDLRHDTRARLGAKLQLGTTTLDSFMQLVDSQLDLSIEWSIRSGVDTSGSAT